MADEVPNRTDMIRHFLGERQCPTHQSGDTLSERIVEALDVLGFPDFPRDCFVSIRWHSRFVNHILIRIKRRLLTVHRQPPPLLVRLFLYKAMHFVGFRLHTSQDHITSTAWELNIQVLREAIELALEDTA